MNTRDNMNASIEIGARRCGLRTYSRLHAHRSRIGLVRRAGFPGAHTEKARPIWNACSLMMVSCMASTPAMATPAPSRSLPNWSPNYRNHLVRYHGCGMGEYLDDEATLAVLVCRLNSLSQGYSGVRAAVA